MFNRIKDNISETSIKHLQINHVELLDSWFKQSCVKEAIQLNSTLQDRNLIFGGKFNFLQRCKNRISKEEYLDKRLSPSYSIGEGSNSSVKANRKFHLEQDLKIIIFKPNKKTKIELSLPNLRPNVLSILSKLYLRQEQKNFSITYKLDQKYIYISFDERALSEFKQISSIDNRVLALDLNPNYIGYSITDWTSENEFKVIDKGIYSLKLINDKERSLKELKLNSSDSKRVYLNNKRKYEALEIAKDLMNKALHFKCELVAVEDLNMKSKDRSKGKNFNHLVNNQWLRNDFVNNLNKRCNIFKIKFQKVRPEYSSFIGNFLYRSLELPDQILSSTEIGRRAYEFNLQYVKKIKPKKKNIISPELNSFKSLVLKSLEEFNIQEQFKTLVDIYYFLKNSKVKYRVSLDSIESRVFRLKYRKSYINCYSFKQNDIF